MKIWAITYSIYSITYSITYSISIVSVITMVTLGTEVTVLIYNWKIIKHWWSYVSSSWSNIVRPKIGVTKNSFYPHFVDKRSFPPYPCWQIL